MPESPRSAKFLFLPNNSAVGRDSTAEIGGANESADSALNAGCLGVKTGRFLFRLCVMVKSWSSPYDGGGFDGEDVNVSLSDAFTNFFRADTASIGIVDARNAVDAVGRKVVLVRLDALEEVPTSSEILSRTIGMCLVLGDLLWNLLVIVVSSAVIDAILG